MKILVFGNELVELDSLALRLLPRLKKEFLEIDFFEADSTESLQEHGRKLNVLDVVLGIENVRVLDLEDFEKLQTSKIFSMHDFDLGYNLKLLKKMNLIDSVRIICLPMGMKEDVAFNQLQSILRKWVAQDMQGS